MSRNTHQERDDHQIIADFVDAYSTGELEQNEKDKVERHLASCQSCQLLLTDIKRLRSILHQYVENDPSRSSSGASFPSVASAVLSQITQGGKRSRMQKSSLERQQEHSFQRRFRRNKWVLSAVALLFLALFIGAFALLLSSNLKQPGAVPVRMPWEIQPDQVVAQSDGAFFEIKYILISPQEIRLFYVARSPHRGNIDVEATSLSPKGNSTPLVASAQPLGQLGAFDVGVIHVKHFLLAGQTIELCITPAGETEPMWKLAPLKQRFAQPHPDSRMGFHIQNQQSREEVLWDGPTNEEQVAFFKLNETKPKPDAIFLRIDDATSVKVITEAEYRRIIGEENTP